MSNNGTANTRYSVLNCTPEAVERMGGENIQVMKHSSIIFADLTETEALNLQNSGCIVAPVERVTTGVIAPPTPTPVGLQPLITPASALEVTEFEDLRKMTSPPLYGQGMKIAMIDTGMRETHEQLAGKVIYSKNYTSAPMRDGFSHGTGTASIFAVVAPECGILNLKVMDDDGNGTTEAVVLAIEDCIDLLVTRPEIAPSLINLSLGTADTGDPNDVLRVACRTAIAKGIWLNAAAGNGGPNAGTIMSPACERYVFAIGSGRLIPLDSGYNFGVSEFSSRGATKEGLIKPDAIFFGENIEMASSESDTAVVAKSGTSFATPFTSGLMLLYMQGVLMRTNIPREAFLDIAKDMPAAEYTTELVSSPNMIDKYLQYITIKPQGVAKAKDNWYGFGLPYGSLVVKMLGAAPVGIDLSSLIGGVMAVSMMGMMMKTMTAGGNGKK